MTIKRSTMSAEKFSEIAYESVKTTMIGYDDFVSWDENVMSNIEKNQNYIDFLDSIDFDSEDEFIDKLSQEMIDSDNPRQFTEFLFYCLSQTDSSVKYDFRERSWNMSDISEGIDDKNVARKLSSALSQIGLYKIVSETDNIKDYYMGVNVGFASDKRKGKQEASYEDIIQKDLEKYIDEIDDKYSLKLYEQKRYEFSNSDGQKTFDFFICEQDKDINIAIEVNCYASTGSKISEISRSSENQKVKCEKDNIEYVRITDGSGLSKKNLKDAHKAVNGNLYNLELFRENFKEDLVYFIDKS